MPWSMYHWLETYALLRDELGDERRFRWEDGLPWPTTASPRPAAGRVHNIPTWDGMATFRWANLRP
ncbi:MAG: hypothetical protein R2856_23140 [Caldilineaceae bacterium]